MKKPLMAICLFFSVNLVAAPVMLYVDNTHSSIQFSVPFLGISEVTGRFENFCGQLWLDDTKVEASQLELFIDASSINTGLKARDRDLVEQYLASKTFPIIHFRSKSLRQTTATRYEVTGDLRLHGVTKELRITLVTIGDLVNGDKAREIGLKLHDAKIDRRDFGILENTMGSGSVGDTISISSVIRVRDVTPYRNDLDKKYPETKAADHFPFDGQYESKTGARITLIKDGSNYFLSFSDDSWSWFAQAKAVGPNLFKLLSFTKLIQLTETALVFTEPDTPSMVFTKKLR